MYIRLYNVCIFKAVLLNKEDTKCEKQYERFQEFQPQIKEDLFFVALSSYFLMLFYVIQHSNMFLKWFNIRENSSYEAIYGENYTCAC